MPRILVIDDEVTLLQLLETYLKRCGHEVTCCRSGRDGLAILDNSDCARFDLAVLDHSLPDIDGIDLLNGVLSRCPEIKVLLSSGGFIEMGSLRLGNGSGIAFLQKPYLPKVLGAAINSLLERQARAAP